MPLANLKVTGKSLAILIAVAAVLFVGNVVVYVMASGALGKAKQELAAREDQVENSKKVAQRLRSSEEQYREVAAQITMLERSVNRQDYIPTLLKQLENTGAKVNLYVMGVRPIVKPVGPVAAKTGDEGEGGKAPAAQAPKPAKKEAPQPYDMLDIDIQVQGTYWNTLRFLDELTRFPKIVAVNTVQVIPGGCGVEGAMHGRHGFSPGLNVTLGITAFVFTNDKDIVVKGLTPAGASVIVEPVRPAPRPKPSVRVSKRNWRSADES